MAFAPQDEEHYWVSLGIPRGRSVQKPEDMPYETKIGGSPAYLGPINVELPLCCPSCGRALPLVAQVYAPAESFPRALHIFGCIDDKCKHKKGSWRVLRSQCRAAEQPEEPKAEIQPPQAEEVAAISAVAENADAGDGWDNNDDDGWDTNDGDDWGMDDGYGATAEEESPEQGGSRQLLSLIV